VIQVVSSIEIPLPASRMDGEDCDSGPEPDPPLLDPSSGGTRP